MTKKYLNDLKINYYLTDHETHVEANYYKKEKVPDLSIDELASRIEKCDFKKILRTGRRGQKAYYSSLSQYGRYFGQKNSFV